MKINRINTKEILDFEKELNVELEVNERPPSSGLYRYYVSFNNTEVSEGSMLIGSFGNGSTIDEALQDYCKEIETKTIVLFARSDKRREILCPKLIHTKQLL